MSTTEELDYIRREPYLSSAYHNVLVVVIMLMSFIWAMKAYFRIRALMDLNRAVNQQVVVRMNEQQAFTATRQQIVQALRSRSSHTCTKVEKHHIPFYVPKNSFSFHSNHVTTDTLAMKCIVISSTPHINVTVYIGLSEKVVLCAYVAAGKNSKNTVQNKHNNNRMFTQVVVPSTPRKSGPILVRPASDYLETSYEHSTASNIFGNSDYIAKISSEMNLDDEFHDKKINNDNDNMYIKHTLEMNIPIDKIKKAHRETARSACFPITLECYNTHDSKFNDEDMKQSHFSFISFAHDIDIKTSNIPSSLHCSQQAISLYGDLFEQQDIFGIETAITSTPDCIICMCDPVNVVILPCRHACVCVDCHSKCTSCPVCRSPITSFIRFADPQDKDALKPYKAKSE